MDFFEHQDRARRKTHVLIAYYILAVILIAVAVYGVVAMAFLGVEAKQNKDVALVQLWNPELFAWVTGATLALVVMGSLFKISQMAGGGQAVAEMLGGRPLSPNARNPDERKVLNVVEEMAIAAGTSVPRVFLLPGEEGINAFAAGFTPDDAVVGVTQGCITQLSRDELQGVIAHEFSHILNGDMRLNIRLIGVLHGILVIGLVGYWVFRSSLYSSGGSRSRNQGNKLPIVLVGLLIWLIGYVGVFFGKLIKSAVSRQREYLADASAVQYTRNPEGIAGALKKIGGWANGSRLQTPSAEQASHFFFSDGLASSLFRVMATHPPLEERIRRLDPSFKGTGDQVRGHARVAAAAAGSLAFAGGPTRFDVVPGEVVSRVGTPKVEHLAHAAAILKALPIHLADAAREPFGARAVVYSLLLNAENDPRTRQLKQLRAHADAAVYSETSRLMMDVEQLSPDLRLPLADLAVSSLKVISKSQYHAFRENVEQLVAADEQIDLFEFTLKRMILRNLEPVFSRVARPVIRYRDVSQVLPSCVNLLSCLAYWGTDQAGEANRAFSAGAEKLQAGNVTGMAAPDTCGLQTIADALECLAQTTPAVTKRVIDACVACIAVDGKITIEEAELIRVVGDSLRCPIPPFLPGQSVPVKPET